MLVADAEGGKRPGHLQIMHVQTSSLSPSQLAFRTGHNGQRARDNLAKPCVAPGVDLSDGASGTPSATHTADNPATD